MNNTCYLTDPTDMLKACERGDLQKVRELLQSDSTLVNAKDTNHKSALHIAAEKNFVELTEFLIFAGADINAEVNWGMTPLQWAANMGSRAAAEILLKHGAAPQLNMWSAAGLGMLDVVRSFWDSPNTLKLNAGQTRSRNLGDGKWGKSPAPESYTELVSEAFYITSRNGHVEVARFLRDKGADINCRGFFGAPGLHWAAINGHKAMVEYLIAQGADLKLRDQQFNSTPLSWALEGKQLEIAELLQAQGVGR